MDIKLIDKLKIVFDLINEASIESLELFKELIDENIELRKLQEKEKSQ